MSFGDKKLSEFAVSVPGSTSLLREYDLDFCCGGSDTLANAAAEKGLNLAEIEKLKRFGLVKNKSLTLKKPLLNQDEEILISTKDGKYVSRA